MRKLLFFPIIFIPLLILGILVFKNQNTNPQKSGAQNVLSDSAQNDSSGNSIEIDGLTFSWYEISDTTKLKLIPNFSEKLSSKEIINSNQCKFLSNGPFYTKENTPTGLVIADANKISGWRENTLFNGILSINDLTTPRITRDVPEDHLQIAVQSGPILKENGDFQTLKIIDDSPARRVLAAVTGENKLFFIVVYDPQSEFSGLKLGDLPNALQSFENKTGIVFADAINLDGGSASAFITKNINLSELTTSGAFFCQL